MWYYDYIELLYIWINYKNICKLYINFFKGIFNFLIKKILKFYN